MKKIIVTTTINEPTEATLKYCAKTDWDFIIVGDTKTPHDSYKALEKQYSNVTYFHPDDQDKKYPALSKFIGWKTIRRRNLGFVEAYHRGADILATVDDDNIPYDNWGKDILLGKEIECDFYETDLPVFDPLSITKENHLWHRGFPIDYLSKRLEVEKKGTIKRSFMVQANLWEGDPDIDAIGRLTYMPLVEYKDITAPYCANKISPFNSQNTLLVRELIPHYAVLPDVGRMDDIWMSYIIQHKFPNSVVYAPATVYQDRNEQDLITNLEHEILGYRKTSELINDLSNYKDYLPETTQAFYELYQEQFN